MGAMADPYDVLGVARDADEDAIRKAYRKLAKKLHPDLNPGKADAADKFAEASAAHDLLSDKEKRGRFDRGEIDAEGREKPPRGYYRDYKGAGPGGQERYSNATPDDLDDLFGAFGAGFGSRARNTRGRDIQYSLSVDFVEAAAGTKKRLALPDGKSLDLTIPPGLEDGQTLRLKGQGAPSQGGGPAGDALIEVSVRPHKLFRRAGDDILLDLPVDAAGGGARHLRRGSDHPGRGASDRPGRLRPRHEAAAARAAASARAVRWWSFGWCCPQARIPSWRSSCASGSPRSPWTRVRISSRDPVHRRRADVRRSR